ncbi:hypothetical protein D3C81_1656300 [compost metagenome]
MELFTEHQSSVLRSFYLPLSRLVSSLTLTLQDTVVCIFTWQVNNSGSGENLTALFSS